MRKILIDSGPLIALFDSSDKHHQNSINFIKNNSSVLITSIASITETQHLIDFNRNAQIDFLNWINDGGLHIEPIDMKAIPRIAELIAKYADRPMDFADACLVYLAEKYGLNEIATIDRDFSIYRINGKKKFKLVLN